MSIGLPALKPYQRKAARGNNRKNLQQVPTYAKGRGDLNGKVESMRKTGAGKKVLSPSDVAYIKQRYNIDSIQDGKELGTTGMTVSVCPVSGQYTLSSR